MMHNLAIITPGSRQTVLDAAVAMGAAGLKKNFIPEIPELLASTPQVAPGMKYTLYFAVPDEPGDYHFICTYPGHGLIMQGIFAVQ
jgi:azurin